MTDAETGTILAGMAERSRERARLVAQFGKHAGLLVADGKHGWFVVDPRDFNVAGSLLNSGVYDEAGLELMCSLVARDRGDHVLVVGAHLGAHVVPLLRRCSWVHAVEANPDTFRLLAMNVSLNGPGNVTLHPFAANDVGGTIELVCNTDNSGGSKRVPVETAPEYTYDSPTIRKVAARRIDDLIGERLTINHVFMDIEGSEHFAIRGAQRILADAESFVVEFIPHHMRRVAGVTPEDFMAGIVPHFAFMYIPKSGELCGIKSATPIARMMFDDGSEHEHIVFAKSRATIDRIIAGQAGAARE